MCSSWRRAPAGGAAAHRLWRQDHHLSPACRGGAAKRLAPFCALGAAWTAHAPLPGGDFPYDGVEALVARARGLWPFLTEPNARRMVRAYGTRLDRILGDARAATELGESFGAELTAAEVRYLMRHEFAETADDVLWRRSKLGLHLRMRGAAALATFMATAAGRRRGNNPDLSSVAK